jgi:O-acetylserine/cysteine efflux transporter
LRTSSSAALGLARHLTGGLEQLIAVAPLAAATLLIDGPHTVLGSMSHASAGGWAIVFWQAYANALLGYSIWNWLLARHPASRIARSRSSFLPLARASAMYLSEPLQLWKLAAAGAVVAGLFLSMIRSTKPVCPSSAGSTCAIRVWE